MKSKFAALAITTAVSATGIAPAQTSYTSTSDTTAWNSARWNNTADGPTYSSTYTANQNVAFTSGTYNFAGMGAAINVGNVTLASGVKVNFTSSTNTFASGGSVRTFDIGAGALLDFSNQSFSTAAGTGFIKNGSGVLALAGNTYSGGFTLNNGTVILRGVNALGAGGALILNGGTVAGSASRDLNGKYAGGITIGGDVQFGEMSTNVTSASNSANLTFSNSMALGSANRTLVLGNAGTVTFGGIISNSGSGGITFDATADGTGRFEVTNTANTFTGPIKLTGGEVRFAAPDSVGNANNSIIIDGGRFSTADSANFTLASTHDIHVGDAAGTSISTPGTSILTYNGVIANKTGETGSWAKQGGGVLAIGGQSTYTGATVINQGTLRLSSGNDRLPTGTVVSLGQAASANLGTLDLGGNSQQIAGLQSIAGTHTGTSTNVVTSATASTLTIRCATSTTYSYGDSTPANSGIISGAISLQKLGEGTQILGGTNTYTGTTTVSEGGLVINGSLGGPGLVTVRSGAVLGGNGIIGGSLAFDSGAKFLFSAFDTLTVNGSMVSFANFSVADLVGLNSLADMGTYALIGGTATFDLTNVANLGAENAYDLGDGKSAYFESGSLNLVVVPEPSAALLGAFGILPLLRRRRA